MSSLPQVAVVGRTNVGKSTLFNRLSERVKTITLNQPGVTRDIVKDTVSWQDCCFELVDTGGVTFRKITDPIEEATQQRALQALKLAELVLLVCDGTVGIVPEDRAIAKALHKLGKQVLLIVNKIDSTRAQEHQHEFVQLGHKDILSISAQHGIGIAELLQAVVDRLPVAVRKDDELEAKVVIVGKPNVGKSSLMNKVLQKERAIVADMPGTTREPLTEKLQFYKAVIQVTDTPGVRKKRAVTDTLEKMMVKRALQAVEDTHIVLLMVDGSQGKLADQELKLAFYAFEQKHKALIILFNKSDIQTDLQQQTLQFSLEEYPHLMKKVEQLTISCESGKNVGRLMPLVQKVWKRYSQWLPADEMNLLIKEALVRRPLHHKTNLLVVHRAKQIAVAPITIVLYVNVPVWFGPSQLGYFENVLRRAYDLKGTPVKFIVRKK